MQPQPEDTSINIPVTFDYRGGRNENKKNKIILTIVIFVVGIILLVGILSNGEMELWKKLIFSVGVFYIGLLLLRFVVFKELYYSDIYENLKAMNFILPVSTIWKIFDIDYVYPYICYFKNGTKGIFVRMEKGTVTGKGENAQYNHYEAISNAYNKAHSLNMDIRHIDYMDNVGNDSRLQAMYDNLKDVENPDMEDMMIDIYSNLQEEMSLNYASFDTYLFLTRDKVENFVYNMQTVCNTMIGGNFITYRVLNRGDLRSVCMALFNFHDFSVTDACEDIIKGESHSGIIPIRIIRPDGVEKLNKTQEEKRIEAEERLRKAQEAKQDAKAAKRNKGKKKESVVNDIKDDDDLGLF